MTCLRSHSWLVAGPGLKPRFDVQVHIYKYSYPRRLSNKGVKNCGAGLPELFRAEHYCVYSPWSPSCSIPLYFKPSFLGKADRWAGTCMSVQHSSNVNASFCSPGWSGSQPSVLPDTFAWLTSSSARCIKSKSVALWDNVTRSNTWALPSQIYCTLCNGIWHEVESGT